MGVEFVIKVRRRELGISSLLAVLARANMEFAS
jgi:hypothetical protein